MNDRRFLSLSSFGFLVLCVNSVLCVIVYSIAAGYPDWRTFVYSTIYSLSGSISNIDSGLGIFLVAAGYGLNGLASRNLLNLGIGFFAGLSFLYTLAGSEFYTRVLINEWGLSITAAGIILRIISAVCSIYVLLMAISVKSSNKLIAILLVAVFLYGVLGINTLLFNFIYSVFSIDGFSTIPYIFSPTIGLIFNLIKFLATRIINTAY